MKTSADHRRLTPTEKPFSRRFSQDSERRQLTVLFADMAGSTQIMEEWGADTYSEILSTYHAVCNEVIRAAGGVVAQYLGDGIVCYFGYPKASEQDPVSAVSAALWFIDQLRITKFPKIDGGIETRIGIATGPVVFAGIRAHFGDDAVGRCLNKAARLQGLSDGETPVICEDTQRLIGDSFDIVAMGPQPLKGFRNEHEVFQVLDAKKGVAYRYSSRLSRQKGSLLGREWAMALLEENIDATKNRSGVATVISGEAGIGKSELLNQLLDSASVQGCLILKLQCSPEHMNSGFFPFINYVRWVAGVSDEASPQEVHDCMLRYFRNVWRTSETETDLMLDLFSPIGSGKGASGAISPPLYRRMMFTCLSEITFRFADALNAMLFVVEDVQWIDSSSAEMLRLMQELSVGSKVIVTLTSRPEQDAIPVLAGPFLKIDLEPLDAIESRILAQNLWPEHELPPETLDAILSKAEGNPFFLAEYLEAVREAYNLGKKVTLDSVPVTINGIVQGKLDRLDSNARRFVQAASTFGRMFDPQIVGQIVAFDRQAVDEVLQQLVEAGFVKESGGLGVTCEYMFRHATVRDGVYASLSLGPRQQLHSTIATRMLLIGADGSIGHERIAEHLVKAERWEDASIRYLTAANNAKQSRSMDDAQQFLTLALSVLENLPAGENRDKQEIRVRRLQSMVLIGNGGPAGPQFGQTVQRILTLIENGGNQVNSIPTLYLNSLHYWAIGEMDKAREFANRMEAEVTPSDGDGGYIALNILQGQIAWHCGENERAIQTLTLAVNRFDGIKHTELAEHFALDFGVYSRFYLSFAELTAGNLEAAQKWANEAEHTSKKMERAHAICFGNLVQFSNAMERGDDEMADKYSSEALSYSVRNKFPEFVSKALFCRGWLACRKGKYDHGLPMMRRGLDLWKAVGFRIWQSYYAAILINYLVENGEMAEAEELLDKYSNILDLTKEHQAKVPMLLARVNFLRAQGKLSQADQVLDHAEQVAIEQSAGLWLSKIIELRAPLKTSVYKG